VTEAELESVAREMRYRGLHSTWVELMEFSRDVIGNLADAYQALLRSMAKSDTVSSIDSDDVQKLVRDKLVKALTLLNSEVWVAKLESKALMESNRLVTQ